MAYLESLHLDEIPYATRWSAADLAYDRDIGWGGGRVIRPRDRPLYGFWLRIARAVRAGRDTEAALARELDCRVVDVSRALHSMTRLGHLDRDGDLLSLTKRTKRQLVEEMGR